MITRRHIFGAALAVAMGSAWADTAQPLSGVIQSQVIRIGAIEAAPWYHQDLLTNKWTGIVPESLELMFKGQGVKIEYVPTDWGTAIAGLQSKKFDIVGAFSKTPERLKAVDFTQPLGTIPTGFVTTNPKFTTVKNWSEIDSPNVKAVAVDGSGTVRGVADLLTQTHMTLVKSSDAMLMEISSGRADVAISNRPTLKDYIAKTHQAKLVVPQPIRGTDAPFAIRKDPDQKFQKWLDARIQSGLADGSLKAIWVKYLGD